MSRYRSRKEGVETLLELASALKAGVPYFSFFLPRSIALEGAGMLALDYLLCYGTDSPILAPRDESPIGTTFFFSDPVSSQQL